MQKVYSISCRKKPAAMANKVYPGRRKIWYGAWRTKKMQKEEMAS